MCQDGSVFIREDPWPIRREVLEMTGTIAPRVGADESEDIVLRSGPDGRLLAVVDGASVAVRVRQCFPWSEPRRHLSLRDADDEEVALVEDPAALPDESRQALEQA